MTILQMLGLIPKVLRRLELIAQVYVRPIPTIIRMFLCNYFGKCRIACPEGPVVSLTTYGRRTETVYLTLESIASGTLLPSRLILWVDENSILQNPPENLRRLMKRGLEILPCSNYGPHKKYYPYVSSTDSFDRPMVTADDDVLYPQYWLRELSDAYQANPGAVSCFRARVIAAESSEMLASYDSWKFCTSSAPRFEHIATGVSGVIYPPSLLAVLKEAGPAFNSCCPRADDIWLHMQAIRAGFAIRQVRPSPSFFPEIPLSQGTALWKSNLAGQNDSQIDRTYTAGDIAFLFSSLQSNRFDAVPAKPVGLGLGIGNVVQVTPRSRMRTSSTIPVS
jgi:hypothetical protein